MSDMFRPVTSPNELSVLISSRYPLRVVAIRQLDGYDDLNFYVECESTAEARTVRRFVCKVLNSLDSQRPEGIAAQHRLMRHLGNRGTAVSQPIRNNERMHFSMETFNGAPHVFRLLEYVEGSKLNDSAPTPELYRNVGAFVGRLYKQLEHYEDAYFAGHQSLWMLESVPRVRSYLSAVRDEERRRLAERAVDDFETHVSPVLATLESGITHGDLNEHNILTEGSRVIGLIDFGDACRAPTLFELAICLSYMCLHGRDVAVGKHVLDGYQSHRELTPVEAELLQTCVRARLSQSLVLGCSAALKDPGNSYILSSQSYGWTALSELTKLTADRCRAMWVLPRVEPNRAGQKSNETFRTVKYSFMQQIN